jgi:phage shock protein A
MQAFKRFTKTLSLSLSTLIDDVQNHDAAVLCAIRELERSGVRVRTQRLSAQRRRLGLEQRRDARASVAALWRERARGATDRESALECLRRARHADTVVKSLGAQCEAQQALLEQLVSDETEVEQKLSEFGRRRASLVSREACASAARPLSDAGDLEAVFDRWQAQVEEREAEGGPRAAATDAFARAFSEREERAILEAELAALVAEGSES